MKTFVLIVVCLYTLGGVGKIIKGFEEEEEAYLIAGIISFIIGVLAIISQSINL